MNIFKKIGLGILAALILWIGGFFVFTVSAMTAKPKGANETTDAIVVLTGGSNRIEEGLSLFASGRGTHLFISGVFRDVKKREILSLWAGDHALPPCCVTLGYEADTTVQNAAETRNWLEAEGYNSVRLVTGNYHMPRAMMELRHALPGIDIYAHPIKQADLKISTRWYWILMFSEYHKCLYRWAQLLITPRTPLEETV